MQCRRRASGQAVGVGVGTLSRIPLLVRYSAYAARCDAVELEDLLIRRPRGPWDCGVICLLAPLRVLHVSREEIPYPHPGEAMDTERDYAANDGGKKSSSSFASRYPHPRPALVPPSNR
jgi:hypothetical protein